MCEDGSPPDLMINILRAHDEHAVYSCETGASETVLRIVYGDDTTNGETRGPRVRPTVFSGGETARRPEKKK